MPWSTAPVIAEDFIAITPHLIALIAAIVTRVPEAKFVDPNPSVEFHDWLTAMVGTEGVSPGTGANLYGESLLQIQRDLGIIGSATATPPGLAITELRSAWMGNPPGLHYDLNSLLPAGSPQTQTWPQNARSREYMLTMLKLGLGALGIAATFWTLRDRSIHINVAPMDALTGYPRAADRS